MARKGLAPYTGPSTNDHCTRCGKRIRKGSAVWLDLHIETGEYQPPGVELPRELSQGGFVFGPDCAKHPNKPLAD